MPSSLIPAIIGSIIESAIDQASLPPPIPPGPPVGMIRTVPATAKIGDLVPPLAQGVVHIDGQALPLSPIVRIRNQQNMIVMPTAVGEPVRVRYLTDASGAVWRVWMLTPAELAAAER
jgi:hypothetical protein